MPAKTPKTRNGGQWTEARFNSFIRSALRQAWMKWPPNQQAKKNARISRGLYLCAGHGTPPHEATASVVIDGKRKNNIFTDHIQPIGAHVSWDGTVSGMFCELDRLQVLCKACHDRKTKAERAEAREKPAACEDGTV